MKRSRIKPFSVKRLAQREARRACVAEVIARDGVCQFPSAYENFRNYFGHSPFSHNEPRIACMGDLVGHEPAHSRNVDRNNPSNVIALCWYHNQLAEDEPLAFQTMGLSVKGNGYPLRHYRFIEECS